MKIVVTGGAGMFGQEVGRALVAAGHDVRGIDRRAAAPDGWPVTEVDLRDAAATHAALDGCDAVVHLGNHPNAESAPPDIVYLENIAMNWHVFRGAVAGGARRLIFASSIQVITGWPRETNTQGAQLPSFALPADGTTPPNPGNPYALSKVAGEDALRYVCESAGLSGVAMRFPSLVPPARIANRLACPGSEPLQAEARVWLSTDSACRLIEAVLATELPGFRVYFPVMPRAADAPSMKEMLSTTYAGARLRRPLEEIEAFVDTSAITRETGWRP